jgi:RimJ/RimL family protein N-acetyltransferase
MKKNFFIVEVKGKRMIREFLMLPIRLYKNEKNWIRPLNRDIESVFDPKKNKHFRHGEAIRWILKNPENETIGRIAAFIDRKIAEKNDQPTGGIGFFECINDRNAAFMLFDKCKEWLQERGMEAMDGPVNFGDRDRWWGLLVEGFYEPNYCMPFNFLYYKDLFEAYGFKNYFNQYTYHTPITDEGFDDTIRRKAERIARNPRYSFRHSSKKNMDIIASEFSIIYNKAWAKFPGVKEITKTHANILLKNVKPMFDEHLFWFGYYNKEPIAFFLMLPEINQIIKYLNGKLDMIGKIKFLYHKKIKKTCTKVFGLIFGIIPEHQGKGIEAAVIIAFSKMACSSKFPYREIEMNWIGDFNPTMMRVVERIGAKVRKTHVTYRYLFDRNKEFKRSRKVS